MARRNSNRYKWRNCASNFHTFGIPCQTWMLTWILNRFIRLFGRVFDSQKTHFILFHSHVHPFILLCHCLLGFILDQGRVETEFQLNRKWHLKPEMVFKLVKRSTQHLLVSRAVFWHFWQFLHGLKLSTLICQKSLTQKPLMFGQWPASCSSFCHW